MRPRLLRVCLRARLAFALAALAAGNLLDTLPSPAWAAEGPSPGPAPTASTAADDFAACQAARKLELADKPHEAFLAYAAIPGTQHLAVRIGRAKPAEYLALLQSHQGKIPAPLAKVVEGDLRLAAGDKPSALACYRAAAKMAAAKDDQGWATGHIPADAYVVEPAVRPGKALRFDWPAGPAADGWAGQPSRQLAHSPLHQPGSVGRRRGGVRPRVGDPSPQRPPLSRPRSRPHGRRQGGNAKSGWSAPSGSTARACSSPWTTPSFSARSTARSRPWRWSRNRCWPSTWTVIPMGRPPSRWRPGKRPTIPCASARAGRFPWASGGVSRKEFVRLAYGVFKEAGKQQDLVAVLEKKIAAGENRLRRVLARVRFHEGKIDEALGLELAYIERADFDPLTAACRQGMVYEEASRPADAADAYERALALPYKPPRLPDPDEAIADAAMQCAGGDAGDGPGQRPAGLPRQDARQVGTPLRCDGQSGPGLRSWPCRRWRSSRRGWPASTCWSSAAAQAEALGRQAAFRDWAQRQVAHTKDPAVAAALHWTLKDYQACVHDLAGAVEARRPPVGQLFVRYRGWIVSAKWARPRRGRC